MAKKLPEATWRVPGKDQPPAAAAGPVSTALGVEVPPAAPLAVKETPGKVIEKTEAYYQEEAAKTHRQLADPGWCLWQCSALGGDVIVVVRDELVTGYPAGYPVYTTQEIIELTRDGVGMTIIRLAHEVKKALPGARVQEAR